MQSIPSALSQLGWDAPFAATFAASAPSTSTPARVAMVSSQRLAVIDESGQREVAIAGALRAAPPEGGVTTGDWVAVDEAAVAVAVLPRRSVLMRRTAGGAATAQAVAANLDIVFIAVPLGLPVGARRLERSLAIAWSSGARPVVLLTKADLSDDLPRDLDVARAVAARAEVIAVSVGGLGLDDVRACQSAGETGAIIGPSGAGKSTLLNELRGDRRLATAAVRADGRGRHTTTHRELIVLPGGALLIDTPGMREMGVWDAQAGIDTVFGDVADLALRCRFSDCAHRGEPGCAVRDAAAADPSVLDRLASMRKLEREQRHLEEQVDARLRAGSRRERKREARALRNQPRQ
ncbi:MAG: ribosome small subunit-dependent GTPase A [Candidatus Dormibacteraeota bacterium]|nr:ribosome small subunit-dependent GTPase A [Candidatus Dormibacteraeota bacterium]